AAALARRHAAAVGVGPDAGVDGGPGLPAARAATATARPGPAGRHVARHGQPTVSETHFFCPRSRPPGIILYLPRRLSHAVPRAPPRRRTPDPPGPAAPCCRGWRPRAARRFRPPPRRAGVRGVGPPPRPDGASRRPSRP